jgi:hypothetical protein
MLLVATSTVENGAEGMSAILKKTIWRCLLFEGLREGKKSLP